MRRRRPGGPIMDSITTSNGDDSGDDPTQRIVGSDEHEHLVSNRKANANTSSNTSNGDNNDNSDSSNLPIARVLLSSVPLLLLTFYAATRLHLHQLAFDICLAASRTFVQLSALALLLTPLFRVQNHSRLLILSYVGMFMIPLAAYEATARSPLTFPGLYSTALVGLGVGVSTSLSVALVVVQAQPWYCPRVVIPLAGMLISNSLSGTALALSELLNELHNHSERIDLLLAFGATPREATWEAVSSVLSKALVPTLNSMNVIGLVAIPGMMTGTILAGSSPTRAARYQIMIMYLIASATGLSAGLASVMAVEKLFDGRGVYRMELIQENTALRVSQLFAFSGNSRSSTSHDEKSLNGAASGTKSIREDMSLGPIELRVDLLSPRKMPNELPVLNLDLSGTLANERPFLASLDLIRGDVGCILGQSGIGKSSLLRSVAELSSIASMDAMSSTLRLHGKDQHSHKPSEWRRKVLYVPQGMASTLPGSPRDLLEDLQQLKERRRSQQNRNAVKDTLQYLDDWGVSDPEKALERPWSDLSGGEGQRCLLAIGFSVAIDVLLLDEPTSALDEKTKAKVETTLRESSNAGAILMVTHDEEQALRVCTSRWRLG